MIESFKQWLGLADPGITDPGRPKLSNGIKINKDLIPDINIKSFEIGPGIAKKTVEDQNKRLPSFKFDVVKTANTRLDPG